MIKKLFMLAVTSGLAAKALQMWIDREARRLDSQRGPSRTEVQRWEDEGGNLPDTAPAPTEAAQAARKTTSRRASAPTPTTTEGPDTGRASAA